jgi:hypothetical protein
MPIVTALGRHKQEDKEFGANLEQDLVLTKKKKNSK